MTRALISASVGSSIATPSSRARFARMAARAGCGRRLELDDEACSEALDQALLDPRDVLRAAVRGHRELAPRVEQRVEGVEELLTRLLAAGEELDVVDQQHVRLAEALLEATRAPFAHRVDELARELLDRGVANREARAEALDVVAHGVQQMRLAQAGRAVQEERVVRVARQLGDGERRRMGEVVLLADHELLEGVLRVQVRDGGGLRTAQRRARSPRRAPATPRPRPRPWRARRSGAAPPAGAGAGSAPRPRCGCARGPVCTGCGRAPPRARAARSRCGT